MRFLAILLAIGLAAQTAFAADQWTEIHSPYFSIVTDGGEKRGREVALHFEQMRAMFAQLMTQKAVNNSRPLRIVAFKDAKGLSRVAPLWQGKPIELAGLYEKGDHEDFIALDLAAENAWSTVFHEYGHLLLNSNSPPTAAWFDEGFAEYFSSLQIDSKEVLVGVAPEYAGRMLIEGPLIPVADMLRVNAGSRVYNESGDHRQMFYAESWAMVHYLYDKRRMSQVAQYFNLTVQQGKPIPESFQSAFGQSPQQFELDLREYIGRGMLKGLRTAAPQGIQPAQFTAATITADDATIVIADMHLNSRDHTAEAVTEYNAVLQAHPDDARAHRGLGFAFLRQHDLPNAELHLEKATANSQDPMVHYYYATLLEERIDPAKPDSSLLARQKQELEKTVELDPQMADAYELLAINAEHSKDSKEAIRQGQNAIRLNPRNNLYAANLSGFYINDRQIEPAREILSRLEQSQDPMISGIVAQQKDYLQKLEEYEATTNSQKAAASTAADTTSSQTAPAETNSPGK